MPTAQPRTLRCLLLSSAVLVPAVLLGMASLAKTNPKPGKKPQTAKEKFKNIKVLKDLPADQLIPFMRQINASLCVGCDCCHVINPDHTGFEKDDKPTKNIARQMVTMTNDLNAKYKVIGKQATCFMCHHGHPQPETKAPQPEPPRR